MVEDRGSDGGHPQDDVLVADGAARVTNLFELANELLRARGRQGRERGERAAGQVLLPEPARLVGEQRPGRRADVERQGAAQAKRHRLHPASVDLLDADRLVAAPDAEEDRLLRCLVNALHHGKRGLALVEAGDDGAAQAKELQAEPVRAPPGSGLDQLELLQVGQKAVDGAPRLADQLGQAGRADLVLLGQPVEQESRLAEHLNRVSALHLAAYSHVLDTSSTHR